jgi:Holliday junction resolvase RusA-like endonuclease
MTDAPAELPGQMTLEDVMNTAELSVIGTPVPQGSKRAFNHSKTGRVVMVDDNPALAYWRAVVDAVARKAWAGAPALDGAVRVSLTFYLRRPKAHYGTGRNAGILKPNAPAVVTVKPDVDKLTRAVFDSLTTAGVWTDDCRAWDLTAAKLYADPRPPGVSIKLDWGTVND